MSKTSLEAAPNASLERYVIPNLRNACRILKELRGHPGGVKAADLARRLGIPVTTTMRIMATLQIEGMVQKNEGRFALGPVLIHLGNAALAGTDIRRLALPVMQKLMAEVDETAHLAVPCNERSLIIAVQDSLHPLRAASPAGFLTDLHSSSTGKIFLAYLHSDQLGEFAALKSPYPHTARTLTKRSDLEREIELTRKGATASTTRNAISASAAWPRRSSRPMAASWPRSASPRPRSAWPRSGFRRSPPRCAARRRPFQGCSGTRKANNPPHHGKVRHARPH